METSYFSKLRQPHGIETSNAEEEPVAARAAENQDEMLPAISHSSAVPLASEVFRKSDIPVPSGKTLEAREAMPKLVFVKQLVLQTNLSAPRPVLASERRIPSFPFGSAFPNPPLHASGSVPALSPVTPQYQLSFESEQAADEVEENEESSCGQFDDASDDAPSVTSEQDNTMTNSEILYRASHIQEDGLNVLPNRTGAPTEASLTSSITRPRVQMKTRTAAFSIPSPAAGHSKTRSSPDSTPSPEGQFITRAAVLRVPVGVGHMKSRTAAFSLPSPVSRSDASPFLNSLDHCVGEADQRPLARDSAALPSQAALSSSGLKFASTSPAESRRQRTERPKLEIGPMSLLPPLRLSESHPLPQTLCDHILSGSPEDTKANAQSFGGEQSDNGQDVGRTPLEQDRHEKYVDNLLSPVSPPQPNQTDCIPKTTFEHDRAMSTNERGTSQQVTYLHVKDLRSISQTSSGGESSASSESKGASRRRRFFGGRTIGRFLRVGSVGWDPAESRLSEVGSISQDSDIEVLSPAQQQNQDGRSILTSSQSTIESELGDDGDVVGAVPRGQPSPFDIAGYGISKDTSRRSGSLNPPANHSAQLLDQVVRAAANGSCRVPDVLDAMLEVSTRLESHTVDILYTYLSTPQVVETCVRMLKRGTTPSGRGGVTLLHVDDPRAANNPYHYVLVNAFIGGQSQLRRALLNTIRARAELFSFFEDSVGGLKAHRVQEQLRVHDMARILAALLRESPTEMTEYISARKGFLSSLIQNHISVLTVAEFVVELCAANPLSAIEHRDEIRYGAPNASGIILLAKERVCETLVDIFESCTDDVSLGGLTASSKRAREEACLYCILELSKRTLVIPNFDKNNCSYGSRYIKQLNLCLCRLSAFEVTTHIARMVQFALGALFGEPGDRGVALVASLEVITELLNTVAAGSESKLASTRLNMRRTPTAELERVILDHSAILSKLVMLEVGQRGSLQRLRLTIIATFQSLYRSKNAETLRQLARSDIATILFQLLSTMEWSSIMQANIVACVELAFDGKDRDGTKELQQAWLTAMNDGQRIWDVIMPSQLETLDAQGKRTRSATHNCGYYGVYMRVGLALRAFAERNKGSGDDVLRELMTKDRSYEAFQMARSQVLDEAARRQGDPIGGPKPEKTTASLLASATSLAALSLDNLDAV
jgi:hypothetical protein